MRRSKTEAGGFLSALCVTGLVSLGLVGCSSEPLPYSSNFSRISLADGSALQGRKGLIRKGYDGRQGRTQSILVPTSCITPDVAEQPVYLPSGCANNLNLQMMVEQKADLLYGRQPGPAAAAPTVRAAERYLYGETEAERRIKRTEQSQEQPPGQAPSPSTSSPQDSAPAAE